MLHVEIRRSSSRDVKELCEFFRFVITDAFMREGIGELLDDIEDEINSKIIHLKNDFESGGTQHYFLIAEHKGEIIGQLKSGQQIRYLMLLARSTARSVCGLFLLLRNAKYSNT